MSKQNGNKGRRFDRAFKEEAVRLLQTSGRRRRQIAGELGISVSTLGRWVTELREEDLLSGPHEDTAKEITRLRRERDLACQERDLLKKALAFFARESDSGSGSSTRRGPGWRCRYSACADCCRSASQASMLGAIAAQASDSSMTWLYSPMSGQPFGAAARATVQSGSITSLPRMGSRLDAIGWLG